MWALDYLQYCSGIGNVYFAFHKVNQCLHFMYSRGSNVCFIWSEDHPDPTSTVPTVIIVVLEIAQYLHELYRKSFNSYVDRTDVYQKYGLVVYFHWMHSISPNAYMDSTARYPNACIDYLQ